MHRYISLLPLLFFFYSCSTLPVETVSEKTEEPTEIVIQETTVYQGLNEFNGLLNLYKNAHISPERNIDNREWLMHQINYWADKDQLAVQRIYEDLLYRNWSDDEKSEYLNSAFQILSDDRETILDDLAYLIDHSLLLQDMPWMVRDFYDERSEFSYWYLLYMGRSIYPFWLDGSVLPTMLKLIPEDRITAVTYLWMKNPENLIRMKSEIYNAGYPWSRLIYLMDMAEEINSQIETLMPPGEVKNNIQAGNLI
ncbi:MULTISPECIES: hypothetical protein [unclassified Oceanispirochaeta]|uniref:hypothetical protein n=1 Tax=unclassified Oceanispirochaeta TaxID=2635722 RepID=UPI000E093C89|nr:MULTISPECIES: hypothetical protein [unclassified Oceanispirochaeta]MBF9015586.1 hypothetical protein [Oceanispirochaeta sp. M2]NPD73925.1 hypothetical protein [Oceanispirochaeta sp. M1]RDG30237.1 hypothetical protein DV872_17670 [Oceanispirochaeta sp. M1]